MRVVIAGGHGQIALLLTAQLATAGHDPVGLVRNPDHVADIEARGGSAIVLDLETSDAAAVAERLAGADAVVFAAGAGPGSSAERNYTLDRDGATTLADAAARAGVARYVLVSAISADDFDPDSTEIFQVYLRAKSEADAYVRGTDLDWTIVRPGTLTNDPATGRVRVAERTGRGEIPRADVAAVVAACLAEPATVRTQFELVGGDTPIAEALHVTE
jgi:uncharacterized protein YbjT (DUF2867 family)